MAVSRDRAARAQSGKSFQQLRDEAQERANRREVLEQLSGVGALSRQGGGAVDAGLKPQDPTKNFTTPNVIRTDSGAILRGGAKASVKRAQVIRGEAIKARADDPGLAAVVDQFERVREVDPSRLQGIADRLPGLSPQFREGQQSQAEAVKGLRGLASGDNSVVALQNALNQQRQRQQIASQLASQRGGFNPASQRAALQALSQGSTQLGAQAAVDRAAEQRGALSDFAVAAQQQRAGDDERLRTEAGLLVEQAKLQGLTDEQRMALTQMANDRIDQINELSLNAFRASLGLDPTASLKADTGVGTGERIGAVTDAVTGVVGSVADIFG